MRFNWFDLISIIVSILVIIASITGNTNPVFIGGGILIIFIIRQIQKQKNDIEFLRRAHGSIIDELKHEVEELKEKVEKLKKD